MKIKESPFLGLLTLVILTLLSACATTAKDNFLEAGNSYARDGLWREAATSYQRAIVTNSENLTAHRNLGVMLVHLGDYKRAIKHLEKSLPTFNDNVDANFYLAEAYRAEERFAKAIFHYQKALQVEPKNTKALKALAWSYFKIRYFSETLSTIQNLRTIDPKDEQAKIILIRTLVKLKRPGDAMKILREAKQSASPANRAYFSSVEGDIYMEVNKLKHAKRAYRAAIKVQPLLAGALFGLGKVYAHEGHIENAIKYLERAVRIRPRMIEAHLLLGRGYEKTNREKALRYYQYFYKHAATDPAYLAEVSDVKKRISALKLRNRSVSDRRR